MSSAVEAGQKNNPAYKSETTGVLNNLGTYVNLQKKLLLEKPVEETDKLIDIKAKTYYQSCKSFFVKKDKESYKKELIEMAKQYGGMPALMGSKWNENNFDWVNVSASILHEYGVDSLINLKVLPDFLNTSKNVLYITPTDLPLPKIFLTNINFKSFQDQHRVEVENDLKEYLKIPVELARQTSQEILDFEKLLAIGFPDENLIQSINESTINTTIEAIHSTYADVMDIKMFLNIVLGEFKHPLYLNEKNYFKNLYKIMSSKDCRRNFANYIFYRLVKRFTVNLSPIDISDDCLEKTSQHFSPVLDNMFYRNKNFSDTENHLQEIWKQLQKSFITTLNSSENSWMAEHTKLSALKKIQAMNFEVVSFKEYNLTKIYEQLNLTADDFMSNMKTLLSVMKQQEFNEIHKVPNGIEFDPTFSFTPFFVQSENKAKVPIATAHRNFYISSYFPKAFEFGSIGSHIAHEISHAFDDKGRDYDYQGNFRSWWDAESLDQFNKRKQCYIKQYSQYVFMGIQLPEREHQSENIADNVGLKIAYNAYLNYIEEKGAEFDFENEKLSSMKELNNKQLFFISFAQAFCNEIHQSSVRRIIYDDEHTLNKFRVIGSLANNKNFAAEFHCKEGDPMNPKEKCAIY